MTRLLLVRHGESRWNVEGRIQGQLDVPLSALGVRQAEAIGYRLRSAALEAVYASPLLRARATAEAIAGPHAQPLRLAPELREIDHGDWQGRTMAEIAAVDADRLGLWSRLPGRVRMPNGERLFDVRQRVLAALGAIAGAHEGQTVAVVSHEVVIKVIVAEVLGLDYDHLSRIAIDNAGLTVIAYAGGERFLLALNDTAHLAGLEERTVSVNAQARG